MLDSVWTDEKKKELERLWSIGMSARDIAAAMQPISRNAVIGKIHRMKLAPPSSKQLKPSQAARSSPTQHPSRTRPTAEQKRAMVTARAAEIAEEAAAPAPPEAIPHTELTAAVCQWPIGDPRSPNFSFCGGMPRAGTPYCAHHGRSAYVPTTRRPPTLPTFRSPNGR